MKNTLMKWAAVSLLGMASVAQAGELTAVDPWIAEAPPGAMALGGYLQLKNNDSKVRSLVAASSADANMVEIHKTLLQDGVASMEEQESVEIPAGESVTLEPGGMHLMIMGPKKQLKTGDSMTITLEMADGSQQDILLTVRKRK